VFAPRCTQLLSQENEQLKLRFAVLEAVTSGREYHVSHCVVCVCVCVCVFVCVCVCVCARERERERLFLVAASQLAAAYWTAVAAFVALY
jgi:hypothetical protein